MTNVTQYFNRTCNLQSYGISELSDSKLLQNAMLPISDVSSTNVKLLNTTKGSYAIEFTL